MVELRIAMQTIKNVCDTFYDDCKHCPLGDNHGECFVTDSLITLNTGT